MIIIERAQDITEPEGPSRNASFVKVDNRQDMGPSYVMMIRGVSCAVG